MNYFDYKGNELYCEDVPVEQIAAEVGTPFYLYSAATITRHFRVFTEAFEGTDHLVCYSVKANSNLAVLDLLAKEGAGADIVSGGELFRALKAGFPAETAILGCAGCVGRTSCARGAGQKGCSVCACYSSCAPRCRYGGIVGAGCGGPLEDVRPRRRGGTGAQRGFYIRRRSRC